jgi:hypothetical protein
MRPTLILILATFFIGSATPAFAATDYLVLTPDSLHPVAKAFASYRSGRGYSVQITKLSEIYKPQSPAKTRPAKIQSYIRGVHSKADKSKAFYVLLIGDVMSAKQDPLSMDRLPCFFVADNSKQTASVGRKDGTISTDNFYALMDQKDEIPDIAIGRIAVKTVVEGLAVLTKLKDYENNKKNGPWRRRMTFFASEGGFGVGDRLLEWLFTRMADEYIPYDFDLNMTYANPSSPYVYLPDLFSDKVIQRANEGSLILNYIGHGHDQVLDTVRWGGKRYPILTYKDLDRIQVQGRYPIFFVVACFTGRYDRRNDSDCIAEKLLKNPNGPSAILASSRISHPYSNAVFQKDFIDQVCRKRVATIGEALRGAKRGLCKNFDRQRRQLELLSVLIVPKKERIELARTHCAMYNLFGDPAMEIQTPEKLALAFKKSTTSGPSLIVKLPAGATGKAIVTVESERSTLLRPVQKSLPKDITNADARSAVKTSYRNANNKVVRRWTVDVKNGQLHWKSTPNFTVPKISGKYYVKVYAWGKNWQGAGSLFLKEQPRSMGKGFLAEEKAAKSKKSKKLPKFR